MYSDRIRPAYGDQSGFTLVELAIVFMIVSILILTALPTFIGQRDRAYDAQSKANLHNGVTAAKAYFIENESYNGVNASILKGLEQGVVFLDAPDNDCTDDSYTSDDQGKIYIVIASSDTTMLCSYSKGSQKPYYWVASTDLGAYNF